MQVLVAYAVDSEPGLDEIAARLHRVQGQYDPLWRQPITRSGIDAGRIGLHIWDGTDTPWRWPSWRRDMSFGVASTYLPLGYERVVGDIEPEQAPIPLARALRAHPERVLDMTAPFVVASLDVDRENLRLHTDAFGLGRLYELRFPGGWVWSNRPAAACRFAGIRAEPDRDGWRTFAATGWFLGDRSPIARVFAVPAGTTVGFDVADERRVRTRVDALATWSAAPEGAALTSARVDAVAGALRDSARSLGRMWAGTVAADLSGGRDSRLVVAGAIAAGLELRLHTNGAEPGEADIAEQLIAALPKNVADHVHHRVSRPKVDGPPQTAGVALDAPLLPNALSWHRNQEGARPSTYLSALAPDGLIGATIISVGGAAGEIAHGHYYPGDYETLAQQGYAERVDLFLDRLVPKFISGHGVSTRARETTLASAHRVLDEAFTIGIDNARMLDYFYAAERIRRWGTMAERIGTITPLLEPEFVRAAFAMTPQQRKDNALHREVTARLVPQWADVPYYQRPPDVIQPALAPRLATAPDHDEIAAIVADPTWSDCFDPAAVSASWKRMASSTGKVSDERLIQRVVWLATYIDYLAEVNGEQRPGRVEPTRAPIIPSQPTAASVNVADRARTDRARTDRGRTDRGRRLAAGALRRVARVVEPD